MLARRARATDLSSWFDEWMRSLPMHRPFGLAWDWPGEDLIRVDEYRDGETIVVRAELPGIDPDKDVVLSVSEGMLRIDAERRIEEESKDKGYVRHELSYGRLTRTLPLPEGVEESRITASYRDGILEVRVPVPASVAGREPTKIAINKGK
ncbi:Hsp20/alpha crystallin family protein [Pseudonocardia acaciae]|uniref:Hsp20/alpha crystallin family protein n=1 Tax=Pseudonocardia acaciae TaxID=551276 RepID=UPI000562CF5B|nr:Hsp20/alpha crystallin family protein [Pseudonocardia acaciae]